MSWKLISDRDREFRKKELQISTFHKVELYLQKLESLTEDEKKIKLDMFEDYLLNYNYTECNVKLYLINDFFNNIGTTQQNTKLKAMCGDFSIAGAIINYMRLVLFDTFLYQ